MMSEHIKKTHGYYIIHYEGDKFGMIEHNVHKYLIW